MAREFTAANDEHVQLAGAPVVTAAPFTLSAIVSQASAVEGAIIELFDIDSATLNGWSLRMDDGRGAKFGVFDDGVNDFVQTFNISPLNTPVHIAAIETSPASRRVILDGDWANSKASGVSRTPTAAALDATTIGAEEFNSVIFIPHDGLIQELAVYDVALAQAEIELLAKFVSPLLVRPESLVLYMPLIRDEDRDTVTGAIYTPVNTPTIGNHMRMVYPNTAIVMPGASSEEAAGGATPSAVLTRLAITRSLGGSVVNMMNNIAGLFPIDDDEDII